MITFLPNLEDKKQEIEITDYETLELAYIGMAFEIGRCLYGSYTSEEQENKNKISVLLRKYALELVQQLQPPTEPNQIPEIRTQEDINMLCFRAFMSCRYDIPRKLLEELPEPLTHRAEYKNVYSQYIDEFQRDLKVISKSNQSLLANYESYFFATSSIENSLINSLDNTSWKDCFFKPLISPLDEEANDCSKDIKIDIVADALDEYLHKLNTSTNSKKWTYLINRYVLVPAPNASLITINRNLLSRDENWLMQRHALLDSDCDLISELEDKYALLDNNNEIGTINIGEGGFVQSVFENQDKRLAFINGPEILDIQIVNKDYIQHSCNEIEQEYSIYGKSRQLQLALANCSFEPDKYKMHFIEDRELVAVAQTALKKIGSEGSTGTYDYHEERSPKEHYLLPDYEETSSKGGVNTLKPSRAGNLDEQWRELKERCDEKPKLPHSHREER